MKYSSSWRKPYRPLTTSSIATKAAAITHTGAGRRPEPEPAADGTGWIERPAPGNGWGGGLARRVGWPTGVTMLMFMDPEPPFKPNGSGFPRAGTWPGYLNGRQCAGLQAGGEGGRCEPARTGGSAARCTGARPTRSHPRKRRDRRESPPLKAAWESNLAGQGDLAKLGHLGLTSGGRDPHSGPGQREAVGGGSDREHRGPECQRGARGERRGDDHRGNKQGDAKQGADGGRDPAGPVARRGGVDGGANPL